MREPRFKALLLDLDGTIADTHHLIHHCLDYTLARHSGRGMAREVWEQWVGVPLVDLFPLAYAYNGMAAPNRDTVISLTACYRSKLAEVDADVDMFPGVREAIESIARSDVRLAIVTTKHRQATERTLANLGLTSVFDAVITGEDCDHYKPHPAPFRRACELLAVNPETCAAVGDSTADILGARAAGIHAAAAMWGVVLEERVMKSCPDTLLRRPQDLVAFAGLEALA